MGVGATILQSMGLVGLRLDHSDPIVPYVPAPTISLIYELGDYLDIDGNIDYTTPAALGIARGIWTTATDIPESTISLREFISAFLSAVAAVFQSRGFAQIAEQLRMQQNTDRILGDVARRLQKVENDSIRQAAAIRRYLVIMPGSTSLIPAVPTNVVAADIASNPPSNLGLMLGAIGGALPATLSSGSYTHDSLDDLVKRLYFTLMKDSLNQVSNATGDTFSLALLGNTILYGDSNTSLVSSLKEMLVERSGLDSTANLNPEYISPMTSASDTANADISSNIYQTIHNGFQKEWQTIRNEILAASSSWPAPTTAGWGTNGFDLSSLTSLKFIKSSGDAAQLLTMQTNIGARKSTVADLNTTAATLATMATAIGTTDYNTLKVLSSFSSTSYPNASAAVTGPFWDNIIQSTAGYYQVAGGSYYFNPSDGLYYLAKKDIVTVASLSGIATYASGTYTLPAAGSAPTIVSYGGLYYKLLATTTTAPTDTTNWRQVYAAENFNTASGKTYNALDLVYGTSGATSGVMYRALQPTITASSSPLTDTTKWAAIGFGEPTYFDPRPDYPLQMALMQKGMAQAVTNLAFQLTHRNNGAQNTNYRGIFSTSSSYDVGDVFVSSDGSFYYVTGIAVAQRGAFDVATSYIVGDVFTLSGTSYITSSPFSFPAFAAASFSGYASGTVVNSGSQLYTRTATAAPTASAYSPTSTYANNSYMRIGTTYYQALKAITYLGSYATDAALATALATVTVTSGTPKSFAFNSANYMIKAALSIYDPDRRDYATGAAVIRGTGGTGQPGFYVRNSTAYVTGDDFTPGATGIAGGRSYWTLSTGATHIASVTGATSFFDMAPFATASGVDFPYYFSTVTTEPGNATYWTLVNPSNYISTINSTTTRVQAYTGVANTTLVSGTDTYFFPYDVDLTNRILTARGEFVTIADKLNNYMGGYVQTFSPFRDYASGTIIFCNGSNYTVNSNIRQMGAFDPSVGYTQGQVFSLTTTTGTGPYTTTVTPYIVKRGTVSAPASVAETYSSLDGYNAGQIVLHDSTLWERTATSAPAPFNPLTTYEGGSTFRIANTYFQVTAGNTITYTDDKLMTARGDFDPSMSYAVGDTFTDGGITYITTAISTALAIMETSTAYSPGNYVRSAGNIWLCIKAARGQIPGSDSAYWKQVTNEFYIGASGRFQVLYMGASRTLNEVGVVPTAGIINAAVDYSSGATVESSGIIYSVLENTSALSTYSGGTFYNVGDYIYSIDSLTKGQVIWQLSTAFSGDQQPPPNRSGTKNTYWVEKTLDTYVKASANFASLNQIAANPLTPYSNGSSTFAVGTTLIYKGVTYGVVRSLSATPSYTSNGTYTLGQFVQQGGQLWQLTTPMSSNVSPGMLSNGVAYWTRQTSLDNFFANSGYFVPFYVDGGIIYDSSSSSVVDFRQTLPLGDVFSIDEASGFYYLASNQTSGIAAYSSSQTYTINNIVSYGGMIWTRTENSFPEGINRAPSQSSVYWRAMSMSSYLSTKGLTVVAVPTSVSLVDRGAFNPATAYALGNTFVYNGKSYVTVNATSGLQPYSSSTSYTTGDFVSWGSSIWQRSSKALIGGQSQSPTIQPNIYWTLVGTSSYVNQCGDFNVLIQAPSSLFLDVSAPDADSAYWSSYSDASWIAAHSSDFGSYSYPATGGPQPSSFFTPTTNVASSPPSALDKYTMTFSSYLTSIQGFLDSASSLLSVVVNGAVAADTSDKMLTTYVNFINNALVPKTSLFLANSGIGVWSLSTTPTIASAVLVLGSWQSALRTIGTPVDPAPNTGRTALAAQMSYLITALLNCVDSSNNPRGTSYPAGESSSTTQADGTPSVTYNEALQKAKDDFINYLEVDNRGIENSITEIIDRLRSLFTGTTMNPLGSYQAPAISALKAFNDKVQEVKAYTSADGNMNVQLVNSYFSMSSLFETFAQSLNFRYNSAGTRVSSVMDNDDANHVQKALRYAFHGIIVPSTANPVVYYTYAKHNHEYTTTAGGIWPPLIGVNAATWLTRRDGALQSYAGQTVGVSGSPGFLTQLRTQFAQMKTAFPMPATQSSSVCNINGNNLTYLNRDTTNNYATQYQAYRNTIIGLFNSLDNAISLVDYSGTIGTANTAMLTAVPAATTVTELKTAYRSYITSFLSTNQSVLIGSQVVDALDDIPLISLTLADTVAVLNSWKDALTATKNIYTSYNADRGIFADAVLDVVNAMLAYASVDGAALMTGSATTRNATLTTAVNTLSKLRVSGDSAPILPSSTVYIGEAGTLGKYTQTGSGGSTFHTDLTDGSTSIFSASDSGSNKHGYDGYANKRRAGRMVTFDGSAVNNNIITAPSHGFAENERVIFNNAGISSQLGNLKSKVANGDDAGQVQVYYVHVRNSNSFQLKLTPNSSNYIRLTSGDSAYSFSIRSDFVEYESSTSVAAVSLLNIVAALQNFFSKKREIMKSDVSDWPGNKVGGTGTPRDWASWGVLNGRMQDVAYNLYISTGDFRGLFTDVGVMRPRVLWSATKLQRVMEGSYNRARDYFQGIVNSISGYSSLLDDYQTAIQLATMRWVTQAFATTSPVEDLMYKAFEADPVSKEEKQLAAKILNLLITILVSMLASNHTVSTAVLQLASGKITLDQMTITISSSLANNMIQRAAAMAADLLERERANKNNSADFIASNPISAQSLFDLASFYQSSNVDKKQVNQLRSRANHAS